MPWGWGGGWARLKLTEPLCVHVCLCRREHELYWTHNFFVLDKGCPILTWRYCFFHRRQTVSYPQESGSHLALTSRRGIILATAAFITRSGTGLSMSSLLGEEKVSRVHSTGKSLDHNLSGNGLSQLSPRSASVADQRVKVQFEKLYVECENLQVQCPKSDVRSEKLKDKC